MRTCARYFSSSATTAAHRRAIIMPNSAAAGSLPRPMTHPLGKRHQKEAGAPAHHNADGTFVNPWNSYRDHGFFDFFTEALPEWNRNVELYALPVEAPPWQAIRRPKEALQALWVGHVTFLVQCGGFNILTDPHFSERASPVQFAGPARYTPPPCEVEALPPIHTVLLSHNHYDHLDWGSVTRLLELEQRHLARGPDAGASHRPYTGTTWYVPLGVAKHLKGMGVKADRIVELDWWESVHMAGVDPAAAPVITAVPAQHQSARYPWDRNASLWCGFVVETPAEGSAGVSAGAGAVASSSSSGVLKWYFSGDTGYRSVPKGAKPNSTEERDAPHCPAFKEIGERFGHFDLALLPIGAYSPRTFMSSFHASPEDAVEMHVDVKAHRSVGMHWGTFALTDEPIEEPPVRLAEALRLRGLEPDCFVALKAGQVYSPMAGQGGKGGVVTDEAGSTPAAMR